MQLPIPQSLLSSLHGLPGYNQDDFLAAHTTANIKKSVRLNTCKLNAVVNHPELNKIKGDKVPWCEHGFYLNDKFSFTFDPYFHAGAYYVQEASSMFLEKVWKQYINADAPIKVLDLCAAPGGKSTHIQSLLHPDSLLVSNELIRNRSLVLQDNLMKWGAVNAIVTNNDTAQFSSLPDFFDVIVVDAPCSGSGLFRKEPDAINEWSEANVKMCGQRQQVILENILPCLKEGGLLIYSTCSYSIAENEAIVSWLVNEQHLSVLPVNELQDTGITESGGGYRFWPHLLDGEGFYLAVFQKNDSTTAKPLRLKQKIAHLSSAETTALEQWIPVKENVLAVKHIDTVYVWPKKWESEYLQILQSLKIVNSGLQAGVLMRNKLVPSHAMAMSLQVKPHIPRANLSFEQAILYLQRRDGLLLPDAPKGWQLVTYKGQELGWVNVLPNRVNNYYPKELRILKERNS